MLHLLRWTVVSPQTLQRPLIIIGEMQVTSRVFPRRWTAALDVDERPNSSGVSVESLPAQDADRNGTETGLKTIGDSHGNGRDIALRPSFRLATYNILTDNCIREGQYLHCPEQVVNFKLYFSDH